MLKFLSLLSILLCSSSIFATAFTPIQQYATNLDGKNIANWAINAAPNQVVYKIKELQEQKQVEDIYTIIENITNSKALESIVKDTGIVLDMHAQQLVLHSNFLTPDLLQKVLLSVVKKTQKAEFDAIFCEVFAFQAKNPLITENMGLFIYDQAIKRKKWEWVRDLLNNEQAIQLGWSQQIETRVLNNLEAKRGVDALVVQKPLVDEQEPIVECQCDRSKVQQPLVKEQESIVECRRDRPKVQPYILAAVIPVLKSIMLEEDKDARLRSVLDLNKQGVSVFAISESLKSIAINNSSIVLYNKDARFGLLLDLIKSKRINARAAAGALWCIIMDADSTDSILTEACESFFINGRDNLDELFAVYNEIDPYDRICFDKLKYIAMSTTSRNVLKFIVMYNCVYLHEYKILPIVFSRVMECEGLNGLKTFVKEVGSSKYVDQTARKEIIEAAEKLSIESIAAHNLESGSK